MALVIAGERSGVGKTTVTLTLLAFLCRRQLKVQSFKVGPDYIDPMFHQYIIGRPCRNLDLVLTDEVYVQQCFAEHSQTVDYALVEGVMGLFDGATGSEYIASTAHVARLLNLPVLLVIDCSRLSGSVAAIAHGYRSFDQRLNVAGVVLNRVGSDRHLQLLKDALEPLNLPILGVLRRQDHVEIPSRHLGLIPTAELNQLETLIDRFAELGQTCFDWERLLPLLKSADTRLGMKKAESNTCSFVRANAVPLKIAVACDRAFSFYYADNLDLLQKLGAELIFWSPLTDSGVPQGVDGLYFGGGFPEVFAEQLADNTTARATVKAAILAGMPTYAECGGLMYLCEQIVDFEQRSWSMVGVLPTTATMCSQLTLGYRQAEALQNSPMVYAGSVVWGHEFHRSRLLQMPTKPLFQTRGYDLNSATKLEGWQVYNVHASYVHLHFASQLDVPSRFLQHCDRFRQSLS